MLRKEVFILLIVFMIFSVTSMSSTNYATEPSTDSGGTSSSSSENYNSGFAIGEIAGSTSSSSYILSEGFLYTIQLPSPAPSGSSSSSSSGGGGGGGGAIPASLIKFTVSPEFFEKTVVLERISSGKITITNEESSEKTFGISVETLNDLIKFDESSVVISSGESRDVEFRIYAPKETGIYTGKIIVRMGSARREVLVAINVRTEKSLFDITLNIPDSDKVISPGKNINAQINLLQMGIKEKMDVTLKYIVKDFSNQVYLTESETIAIYDKKTFDKRFHTQELPIGDYVVGVELVYADGVAVASSHFSVRDKVGLTTEKIVLAILSCVFIGIIIVLWFVIKRYKKRGMHLKNKRDDSKKKKK